ncbi:MAG: MBL fold metallo-hydrolase [Rhodospirillales bacterium]
MTDTPTMQAVIIPVTAFQQNCSVLWCTKTMRGAVVDPGGDLDAVLGAAEEQGVAIEKILLTHGHIDHAGAAGTLADRLGLKIEGPQREDQFLLSAIPEQSQRFGLEAGRAVTPDRWLEGGDTATFGAVTLEVRHCPGHTPGHIVYFNAADRVAVVGDVLFRGSIGRTDFPRGNHADLIRSITTQLWPLGDDVVFIPGHGQLSTFGDERRTNPFVADKVLRR